ncbi:MAG: hypothetical protein QM627_04820 [Luteolibacter sp.]
MSPISSVLERLDAATVELHAATQAALALARVANRELEAKLSDGDDWTRLPAEKGGRCPVSNWSRRTIFNRIKDGSIRSKHVGTAHFYSLADVQRLISEKENPQTAPTA